jgi:hypothetical protein
MWRDTALPGGSIGRPRTAPVRSRRPHVFPCPPSPTRHPPGAASGRRESGSDAVSTTAESVSAHPDSGSISPIGPGEQAPRVEPDRGFDGRIRQHVANGHNIEHDVTTGNMEDIDG